MAILSLSVAALLLYQCFDLLLVQDNTIKPVKHCQQTKHETLHDKKYGYFLQITDTHVTTFTKHCMINFTHTFTL